MGTHPLQRDVQVPLRHLHFVNFEVGVLDLLCVYKGCWVALHLTTDQLIEGRYFESKIFLHLYKSEVFRSS